MEKWKKIAIAEALCIAVLFIAFLSVIGGRQERYMGDGSTRLLSQRIYSGVLEPQSRLIYNFDALEDSLGDYIKNNNRNVSVYLLNLRDGATMGVNENEEFEPASLNKLLMAILILKKTENGEISLETMLPITKDDADINSGKLHARVGELISVKDLLREMLSNSDNTAFFVLNHEVTTDDWRALSEYLDYYESKTANKFITTTPKLNSHIFSSLYLSTVLEPQDSEYILKLLTETSFDIKRIADLPDDVIVAQKFGNYYNSGQKSFHDCGIMYLEESRFFYCVMTKDLSGAEAEKEIGFIVHEIYEYIVEKRSAIKMDPLV